MAVRTLRIFVSSPGDVGQERVIASRVLERLQGEFSGFAQLEPVLWEHEPLRATSHFQKQITSPSDTDIMICILWSRLGTRLPAEQFRKVDGTAYASGTEWEFEDAAAAYLSKGTPDLVVYRKLAESLLDFHDEQGMMERLQQKKALDMFIDHWFGNPEQGFKAAFHGFRTADEFEELLDVHLRKLIRERLPEHLVNDGEEAIAIRWFKGTPYRGLEAFEFEHAPVFYGRTRAIGAVKEILIRQAAGGCAFVLVLGMSGGGKSSLVRAGILPTITHPGVIEGIGFWRWCIFRPSDAQQGDLADGLALALLGPTALPEMASIGMSAVELASFLRNAPERAVEAVRQALTHAAQTAAEQEALPAAPSARLAVMIDQMEELFTREQIGSAERDDFVTMLDSLARSGVVWVIGTMRSDFYPRCAEIPRLVAMKEGGGQYDLLPPNFAEIGQMIRFPTRAAGLRFEVNPHNGEGLDDVLHEAAAKDTAALPLLEFTLDELFRQRTEDRVLTYAAYQSLGGLEGALARRAEELFQGLTLSVQQQLSSVMRVLVTINESDDGLIVSRRVPLSGVATGQARRALVDAFVAARLLVTDRADNGEAVVRVAHEALISRWPRIQQWLLEDRDFLRIRSRVTDSEARWREEERRADFLLPLGKPLAEAEDILRRRRDDLDPALAGFIEASKQRARQMQKRRNRSLAVVAIGFCLVVLGFGAFSLAEAKKAKREAYSASLEKNVANAQRLAAESQRQSAVAARRESELARHQSEIARRQSEQARRLAETQRTIAQEQTLKAKRQKQLADEQRQIAEVQKAVAERNFNHALGAADTMVTDVADGIAPIAGTQSVTVRNILASASQVYETLAQENPTPAVLEGKARMLNSFVEIYLKLNDSGHAAASAQASLALYKHLHRLSPGNAVYSSGLARSEEMLSRVRRRRGNLPAEIAALRASLALRTQLIQRQPSDLALQAASARVLRYLGSALHAQGDREGQKAACQAAYQCWYGLVKRNPGNAQWRQNLAASQNSQGDMAWDASDYPQAEKFYRDALGNNLSLVTQGPNNTELQQSLAQSFEDLAFICKEKGDLTQALAFFDRAIALARHFSAVDVTDVNWLNLLLDCQLQRTDVAKTGSAAQNLHDRLVVVQEIFPKVSHLASEDPANAQLRDSLCVLWEASGLVRARLAQLGEAPRENWSRSYQSYQNALRLNNRLHTLDPTNTRWETRVMLCVYDIGNWYNGQGKWFLGQKYLQQSLRIKAGQDARLAARFLRDAQIRHNLGEDYLHAALYEELAKDQKPENIGRELQSLETSENAYRYALAMPTANAEWPNDLASVIYYRALCHKELAEQKITPNENWQKASAAVEAARVEYQRRLAKSPDDTEALRGMLAVFSLKFVVLSAQGRLDEAKSSRVTYQQITERLSSRKSVQDNFVRPHTGRESSVSSEASSALSAGLLVDSLRKELALALPLYLAAPTTAHYRALVGMCDDFAHLVQQTPIQENLTEARKVLATGYAAFAKIKESGKLAPIDVQDQEALQKTLVEMFGNLPPASQK